MWKKICGFIISLSFMLISSGCGSEPVAAVITKTPVVATVSESTSFLAATDYCIQKGYDVEELYSLTDCAVAVEGGKYDYLICDEYMASALDSFDLKYIEDCSYESKYSMCFGKESTELCQQFNTAIKNLTEDGTIGKVCDTYKKGEHYKTEDSVGNELYILFIDGISDFSIMNDDGEAEGLEIDIMYAICNSLGYTPVFINGEYDEGYDGLLNSEVDLIMSVDSVNSHLEEDFVLSDAYLTVKYQVYGINV